MTLPDQIGQIARLKERYHGDSCVSIYEGVAHLRRAIPEATLWLAALDERLNERNYIVPGLGDAGDLAYGAKQ